MGSPAWSGGIICTPGGAATTAKEIGTIGDGHSEICEGQVRALARLPPYVQTHVLLTSAQGMAPKLHRKRHQKNKGSLKLKQQRRQRQPQCQRRESRKRQRSEQHSRERQERRKKQSRKLPKEAAKQPSAVAAPMEAKPQAPKKVAKQPAKQLAEAAPTKKAQRQAPQEAPGTKEAKPQAPWEAKKKAGKQPAEEWLQAEVSIRGWAAESDDSTSDGHSATFSAGEIAELTDVELPAYSAVGAPPADRSDWGVPRKCGIAPVGRSWQDKECRRQYRTEYPNATANAAGLVTTQGKPSILAVTTRKDRVAKETEPTAYCYIEGTMPALWDSSEFMRIEEWLEGQESAPEAEVVAEKGRATEQ